MGTGNIFAEPRKNEAHMEKMFNQCVKLSQKKMCNVERVM